MIEQETINQILSVADIVDVVSDFVELKRSGSGFKGLCPFHNEKTPSFSVSPSLGICKCFSCGKGGSPLNFIMEHEHMTYIEAIRYLAKKYHIEIKETNLTDDERQARLEREALMKITACAQSFFVEKFSENIALRNKFLKNGFTESVLAELKIGVLPNSYDELETIIQKNGLNTKLLHHLGFTPESISPANEQISLPVTNIAGAVIGFAVSSFSESFNSKVTLSSKNALFRVEDNLYNFASARQFIVKNNLTYLTANAYDCAILQQAGLKNVVSLLDDSISEQQCVMLKRLSNNLCLVVPHNTSVNEQLSNGILSKGFSFTIIQLPTENFSNFVFSNNSQYIINYFRDNTKNFVQWIIDSELAKLKHNPDKTNEILSVILHTIAAHNSQITRTLYAQYVSSKLNISESIISSEIEKISKIY